MKVSAQWLSEILKRPLDINETAERLTMAGLEIESVEPVAAEFSGVVVGHVVAREQHPDADRLSVCQVDLGNGESPVQIVCGAANVRQDLKVAVAQVGAVLPGDFKIKRAKLRGVESLGMICSSSELGLSESSEGIIALAADAPVGQDFREYYQLNDQVLDISITPNRGDCLSMHGVARDLSALDRQLWQPQPVAAVTVSLDDRQNVMLDAPTACPRYVGRVLRNLNATAKTPLWMEERLRRAGVRASGLPVVDSINYVMLETGQPMHAFDADKITGTIRVQEASADEKVVVLGGQEVWVKAGSLLITDEVSTLAVAGVMGGEASAVTAETTAVFLESAYFSPEAIAKSSKVNALRSDSSFRYERGVDFNLQAQALERVTQLIVDLCGAEVGPVTEAVDSAHLPERQPITLRQSTITRYLGLELEPADVEQMLTALDLQLQSAGEGVWTVQSSSRRFDIEQEVDLVEEVIRLYGYNAIPYAPLHGELRMAGSGVLDAYNRLKQAKSTWVERGYCEAITYSFVEPELEQTLAHGQGEAIALMNPLAADMSVMRRSLWAGLLQALQYNLNRQQNRVRLFEYGKCFARVGGDIVQTDKLAAVIAGHRCAKQWNEPEQVVDFYDLKRDVSELLSALAVTVEWQPSEHVALHPHQQQALVRDGEVIGYLGALHPQWVDQLDLSQQPFLFEINWSSLKQSDRRQFKAFSRFPAVKRDLSFVVNESITASEICDRVCKLAGPLLNDVQVFDIYRSSRVGEGKKSVSLGLAFQDAERTLVDTEIDHAIQLVVDGLADELGTQLRD